MTNGPQDSPPVVEEKSSGDNKPDLTLRALQQRIRLQEIISELGVSALKGATFDKLLNDTVRLTAEGLNAELCKILEYLPSSGRLLVRAGIGWGPGIIGVATIGADLASPAGFALRTGKPVISNHLEDEQRFTTPEMLRKHGVRRAMNVILQGDGRPFGVLEVDSTSENDFEERDLAFLQGVANLLGMAIERERHERSLKAALDRQQFLLKEMNHRVKNSLSIVSSMLNLQSRAVGDAQLTSHLTEASHRVSAIARAHDQLSYSLNTQRMDLGKYIHAICKDLNSSVAHCDVQAEAEDGIEIDTDKAISVALIVNELVTNAAKYAYTGRVDGRVWVKVSRAADSFAIIVRDEGAGLPSDFDIGKAKGLGMRIISLFAKQLNATVSVRAGRPGTEFTVSIPLPSQR
ncbi:MAG: sensor histidine kinase [Hyphomicrobiaceae bacterium]